MARTGGVLVLLASLGLTVLLALRLREEHYSGPAYAVGNEVCSFYIEDPRLPSGFAICPRLPTTFPADLGSFSLLGTKGDSEVVFELRLPSELRIHAVENARVEIRHDFLDLPIVGPVVGRTTVKVGSAEWRQNSGLLWGTMAGIAVAPGLLWLLVAVPVALLEKRPSLRDPTT